MPASLPIIIISAGILAWALIFAEAPIVRAALMSGGAAEHRFFKILLPILAAGAVILPIFLPTPVQGTIRSMAESSGEGNILVIATATVLSTLICSRASRFAAPAMAATGALFGTLAASGTLPLRPAAASLAIWIAAPVLAAILSLLTFKAADRFIRRRGIHLLKLDATMKALFYPASVLLIAATVYNAAPVITSAALQASTPGIITAGVCLACAIGGYALLFNIIRVQSWDFADRELDISSPALLSVILSSSIVLAVSPAPLSASLVIIAAMAGVSLSGDEAILEKGSAMQAAISAIASPAIAFLLGYGLESGNNPHSLPLILILLASILAAMLLQRTHKERELQRSIISSRERQIESNRRSLTALEVRSEMVEKDLESKLEAKRKELVDFALGIGEQKKYMEELYTGLQEARSMSDPQQKDRRLDGMLGSLRERMYFTREMNDFYAQSEILHKDFNLRLRERFPDLTENERKLANLLRQGFSSKYIASLMNITPKSVEINRYRLRARLGLKRSDNLINFIKSI